LPQAQHKATSPTRKPLWCILKNDIAERQENHQMLSLTPLNSQLLMKKKWRPATIQKNGATPKSQTSKNLNKKMK